MPQEPTRRSTHPALLRTFAIVLLVSAVGCNLFADPRDLRKPKCNDDPDCDDGLICNGEERCAPDDPTADRLGCVPSTGAPGDDGIECTVDICDEEAGIILNDPANCACQGNIQCPAPVGQPCMLAVCSLDSFTCTVAPRPEGAACDDGVACTTGTICTQGQCANPVPGEGLDHAVCDDGEYCNGAELCAPGTAQADPLTGCVAAIAPALDPANDDGLPCSVLLCDEESDALDFDYTACPCSAPEDCSARNVNSQCKTFLCGPETNWTCDADRTADAEAGTPCDDGIACTVDDSCDGNGRCVGLNLNAWCQTDDPCHGLCQPGNVAADADGCIPTAPVTPVPDACR